MGNTNTPRDFFLHISAFVALYFVAIAATTLLFTLIDYRFPDVLQGYYGDPYSGPVRFAIASLIILAPIFVFLMRAIQNEARTAPERASLPIRKWLTYITLFLAGMTVVIDLIVLLNSFLGGALPTAFALKALTLLIIAGAGFGYFFLDLKGYWNAHPAESTYASYGFLGSVIASIVLGFIVLGSPATQRDLRLDMERISSLSLIQSQAVSYWQQNRTLPETIDQLDNPIYGITMPLDPVTREPYTYEKTGDTSFTICATFARESAGTMSGEYYPEIPGLKNADVWEHSAGETCFEREIDTNLIKPFEPTMLPPKEIIIN
jgi:hypothetical protein